MDLVAGYAYLDSAVIYSKFFPTSVGYPLANVPKQTFNLFVTHRLPWRLNGGLGRKLCGEQDGEFDRAVCADWVCAESEWAGVCGDRVWR